RFNTVQGSYYRVGAEIARLEQSVQHRKDLIQRQREDLESTDAQSAEIRSHIASDEVELSQLDQLLGELGPGLQQAHEAQRISQQSLDDAERAMEQWRERWEQIGEELAAAERASHVEETRIEQLAAHGQWLDKERQKQAEERAGITFEEIEARLEMLVAAEEKLASACGNATQALETVWQQIQQLREQEGKISLHL